MCLSRLKKGDVSRVEMEKKFKSAKIAFVQTSGPTLHAKTLRVDDILFIGSENFTRNSLDANREIGRILPYAFYEKMVS